MSKIHEILVSLKHQRTAVGMAVLLALGCNSQQVNWSPDPPWAKAPVSFQWSTIDSAYESSMTTALAGWNHAAGCTVAVKADDPATADVDVAFYEGTICSSAAPNDIDTTPGALGGYARCSATHGEIMFTVLSDLESAFEEMEHETGHALGLAHDDSELMNAHRRQADPAALGGNQFRLFVLPSDEDGAAVAGRFCR